MSISQADEEQFRRDVLASLHAHWVFYLIEGFILALGAAAIIVPTIGTLATTIFLGWLLLFSGIIGLFTTFRAQGVPGFWWSLLSAILAIVIGPLLILQPVGAAMSLTFMLGLFFAIEGVLSIMFALDHRRELPGA